MICTNTDCTASSNTTKKKKMVILRLFMALIAFQEIKIVQALLARDWCHWLRQSQVDPCGDWHDDVLVGCFVPGHLRMPCNEVIRICRHVCKYCEAFVIGQGIKRRVNDHHVTTHP